MTASVRVLALLALVLPLLAGCGRKGELEPPGGLPERSATPASLLGTIAADPADEPAAPKREDRPFVLDPLI